ncbi:hypothetical protein CR513_32944, partial [Mucuna pruriens]
MHRRIKNGQVLAWFVKEKGWVIVVMMWRAIHLRQERSERPRRKMRHGEEEPRRDMRYEEELRRVRRYEEEPKRAPLDTLKYKIPPFLGDKDVKSYLEWEIKVDQVLECFNYDELVKVKIVTYEFSGYALVWWNQYIREIKRRLASKRSYPSHHSSWKGKEKEREKG